LKIRFDFSFLPLNLYVSNYNLTQSEKRNSNLEKQNISDGHC